MVRRTTKDKELGNGAFLQKLRDNAVKQFGSAKVQSFNDLQESYIGVPLTKCLPLQWVLGIDSALLGRFWSVVGPPKTHKSSFTWWLGNQFLNYNGTILQINAEDKTNMFLVRALLRNHEGRLDEHITHLTANTQEEMVDFIRTVVDHYKEEGAAGTHHPALLIVDSLAAIIAKGEQELLNDGKAGTGFSDAKRAKHLQDNLKALLEDFRTVPVSCVMINHQHTKLDTGGWHPPGWKAETYDAGGVYKDYSYVHKLQFEKGPVDYTKFGEEPGFKIKAISNTFKQLHKHPVVVHQRSLYRDQGEQYAWLDWNTSLAQILTSTELLDPDLIKEVLGPIDRKGSKIVRAPKFDLVNSDISLHDFGKLIHNSPEWTKLIQDELFFIKRTPKAGTLLDIPDRYATTVPESTTRTEDSSEEPAGRENVEEKPSTTMSSGRN